MNSRNSSEDTTANRNPTNRINLISYLRNHFTGSTEATSSINRNITISSSNLDNSSNEEDNPNLTRDVLQVVWSRLQGMNRNQRNIILSSLGYIPSTQPLNTNNSNNSDEESENEEEIGDHNRSIIMH